MQNQDGQLVDLYVPRRCSATNRIIASKDAAAVSINVAHVNAEGRYMGNVSAFNLCGYIRAKVRSAVDGVDGVAFAVPSLRSWRRWQCWALSACQSVVCSWCMAYPCCSPLVGGGIDCSLAEESSCSTLVAVSPSTLPLARRSSPR